MRYDSVTLRCICLASITALALAAPAVRAQDRFQSDPISMTPPAAKIFALPNMSHRHPVWAMSAPVTGFDPPIPVETITIGRGDFPNLPPAWTSITGFAGSPKAIRTVTIRPDGVTDSVAASAGGYSVQVSAQRTEADVLAASEALRAKYPNVLGDHPVMVRRADLGQRGGVWYRAQFGPFETLRQANELCNDLKAAGGQCIVQRN